MKRVNPRRRYRTVRMNVSGSQKSGKFAVGVDDLGVPLDKLFNITVMNRRPHPNAGINKSRHTRKLIIVAFLKRFSAVS